MTLQVIGNVTLDKIYKLDRFPNPGETLLAAEKNVNFGGKGLNQAVIAAKSGIEVEFLSAVGNKSDNQPLIFYLDSNGLQHNILTKEGFTDESIIYYTYNTGENTIVSTDNIAKSINPIDTDIYLNKLKSDDYLLLQGNLSIKTTSHCIKKAASTGAQIVLNLAPITYKYSELWSEIDYLIINEEESRVMTGIEDPEKAINILRKQKVKNIIITLGKEGLIYSGQAENDFSLPAQRVEVKDTTGAGDTFTAIFVAGLVWGLDIKKAAEWAVKAASITVTRRGTSEAFPTVKELEKIREGENDA